MIFQETRLEVMGVWGEKLDSCFLLATSHMLPNWQGDCPAPIFIISPPTPSCMVHLQTVRQKKGGKKCIQLQGHPNLSPHLSAAHWDTPHL